MPWLSYTNIPKKSNKYAQDKIKSTVCVLTQNQGICFEFRQYNIHVWNKHTRITAKLLHNGKLLYCPYIVAISINNLDAKHSGTLELYR